ncbi:MAG: hypothetical protein K0S56_2208 [Microvirga sp.]|jgi:hypothetical protein|nr:hypothetical protein [Microvirga sp.]
MIVRSAYLEGKVADADRARFDRHMGETVLDAIRTYPHIRDVKLRWVSEPEEGAPPVYAIFDLYFDSLDDMEAALASETRQRVRATISEAMSMFRGRVYHLVSSED